MPRLLSVATALVAVLLLTALSGVARADTLFSANITTSQENPPTVPTTMTGAPRPMPFGLATFSLNDAMNALTFTAVVFNLDFGGQTPDNNDNLVAAHIHAGPAVTPSTNGPVVWGFFGTPFNETSPNDQLVTPFAGGLVGGMISGKWDLPEGNMTTLAAQLANILEGRSYINFHTTQFPGGEIRGAILQAQVPEPASILLLFAGTIGLFGACRRKGSV